MGDSLEWTDETRERLRNELRCQIRGELRLARREDEEILESCREVFFEDDCPADDRDLFIQFAREELNRAKQELAADQSHWPAETDCDRLDRVEAALRERGIVLWQVSPCCDTCTHSELPDRVEVVDGRYPGFRERLRGYSFFIDQNMPEMLAESTAVSIYLAYGWLSANGSDASPDEYLKHALNIGHEVCDCLRGEGFEPDWNGSLDRKIGLSVNWQRRTLLQ